MSDQQQVTDADIERIIAENEAGISDLLEVYGHVEEQYFAAVLTAEEPSSTVILSTTTTLH